MMMVGDKVETMTKISAAEMEKIKDAYEENVNKGRESFHVVGLGSRNRNPSETCILLMSKKSVWHGE
jgi:hypothetical protein